MKIRATMGELFLLTRSSVPKKKTAPEGKSESVKRISNEISDSHFQKGILCTYTRARRRLNSYDCLQFHRLRFFMERFLSDCDGHRLPFFLNSNLVYTENIELFGVQKKKKKVARVWVLLTVFYAYLCSTENKLAKKDRVKEILNGSAGEYFRCL